MPHRRRVQKGSFGGHFDELIAQFPLSETMGLQGKCERSQDLQDKIDIHALLFDRAWKLDREP